jgi:hypothetical protein
MWEDDLKDMKDLTPDKSLAISSLSRTIHGYLVDWFIKTMTQPVPLQVPSMNAKDET